MLQLLVPAAGYQQVLLVIVVRTWSSGYQNLIISIHPAALRTRVCAYLHYYRINTCINRRVLIPKGMMFTCLPAANKIN